jgi:hypothetical protein
MADPGRNDPLRGIRDQRLPLLLQGERVRIHFTDSATVALILTIKIAGMDFIGGTTDADAKIVVPLTAISYVEFP